MIFQNFGTFMVKKMIVFSPQASHYNWQTGRTCGVQPVFLLSQCLGYWLSMSFDSCLIQVFSYNQGGKLL